MKHNKGKRQAAPTSAGKGRQLFSMVILFSMLLLAGAVVFATDGATTSYIKIEKKLELAADGIKTPETFQFKIEGPDGSSQVVEVAPGGNSGNIEDFIIGELYTVTEINASIPGYSDSTSAKIKASVTVPAGNNFSDVVKLQGPATLDVTASPSISYTVNNEDSIFNGNANIKVDSKDNIEITEIPVQAAFQMVTTKQPQRATKTVEDSSAEVNVETPSFLTVTPNDGYIATVKNQDSEDITAVLDSHELLAEGTYTIELISTEAYDLSGAQVIPAPSDAGMDAGFVYTLTAAEADSETLEISPDDYPDGYTVEIDDGCSITLQDPKEEGFSTFIISKKIADDKYEEYRKVTEKSVQLTEPGIYTVTLEKCYGFSVSYTLPKKSIQFVLN